MYLLYAVVVLMCLGAPVLGQPPVLPFDCRGFGLSCGVGTCDTATGDCICPVPWDLPDCNQPDAATITANPCDDPAYCTNGVCSKLPGTDTCYCDGDYMGTLCDTPRVNALCYIDKLLITITPYATFSGEITVFPSLLACAAVTAGAQYSLDYLDTNCGGPYAAAPDPVSGDMVYTVIFLFKYQTTQITSTDEFIEVKCKVSPTITLPAYTAVYAVDPNTIYDQQPTYSGTFDPPDGITFSMESPAGTAIVTGDIVNVGDEIVCIITQEIGGYEEFIVDSFTVDDGAAGGTVINILDGCVNAEAQGIFTTKTVDTLTAPGVTQVIKITTTVPKFLTTDDLQYSIIVTVCDAADPACDQDPCTDPTDIFTDKVDTEVGTKDSTTRRRRRAAGDESDKSSKTGSASFNLNVRTLRDDINAIKNKLDRDNTATSCMRSIVFLIPMILLALMLLISMAMTLYFCLKVTRRRDKDDREFGSAVNMGYKA